MAKQIILLRWPKNIKPSFVDVMRVFSGSEGRLLSLAVLVTTESVRPLQDNGYFWFGIVTNEILLLHIYSDKMYIILTSRLGGCNNGLESYFNYILTILLSCCYPFPPRDHPLSGFDMRTRSPGRRDECREIEPAGHFYYNPIGLPWTLTLAARCHLTSSDWDGLETVLCIWVSKNRTQNVLVVISEIKFSFTILFVFSF